MYVRTYVCMHVYIYIYIYMTICIALSLLYIYIYIWTRKAASAALEPGVRRDGCRPCPGVLGELIYSLRSLIIIVVTVIMICYWSWRPRGYPAPSVRELRDFSGEFPVDLGIPHLAIRNLPESHPLKSRFSLRGLTVDQESVAVLV